MKGTRRCPVHLALKKHRPVPPPPPWPQSLNPLHKFDSLEI